MEETAVIFRRAALALLLVISLAPLWASGWTEEVDHTDPDALSELIETQARDYVLIDVRSEAEYQSGHIPTAVNIPFGVLSENLPTEDREALIIVYCRSGGRSNIAYQALTGLGFTKVYDFGGIDRWPGELDYPEAQAQAN